MISSHTKNIVLKKRGREKTVNTVAEYQPAASDIFQKGRQNGSMKNKLMPIKKDGSVSVKT